MDGDVVFITQWGIYTFDATLEDSLEASVELPSYVTESGVRINDHRIVQPMQLRVTGIVSSISFGMISSIFNNLTNVFYARPATALQLLLNVINNSQPFSIVTRNAYYNNFVVRKFKFTRTPNDENALIFELELQEFMQLNKLQSRDQPNVSDLQDGDVSQSAISSDSKTGTVPTLSGIKTGFKNAANKVLDLL